MRARRRLRLAWLLVCSSLAGLGLVGVGVVGVAACASDARTPWTEATDAGADGFVRSDGSVRDDGPQTAEDSGDAAATVVDGPGEAGAPCSFNRECNAALRCECASGACACTPGPRGTGRNGIDPCDDGNACASSVCIEGPPDSGWYCSDECDSSAVCTGKLPLCSTIALVGRICAREKPP